VAAVAVAVAWSAGGGSILTRILPIRVPLGSDHGYEVHIFLQYSNRFHTSFAGYRLLDVLFEGRVLTSDVYQDIFNCFVFLYQVWLNFGFTVTTAAIL